MVFTINESVRDKENVKVETSSNRTVFETSPSPLQNFLTAPLRVIMSFTDYLTTRLDHNIQSLVYEQEKSQKNRILYGFKVRLQFPGSIANVLWLTLTTPHIHGYVGEKNTWVSHMSKAVTAKLINLPAVYSQSISSDFKQVRKLAGQPEA